MLKRDTRLRVSLNQRFRESLMRHQIGFWKATRNQVVSSSLRLSLRSRGLLFLFSLRACFILFFPLLFCLLSLSSILFSIHVAQIEWLYPVLNFHKRQSDQPSLVRYLSLGQSHVARNMKSIRIYLWKLPP